MWTGEIITLHLWVALDTKLYSGGTPTFDEGDIFKITIPLKNIATAKVGPDSESVGEDVSQGGAQDEVDLQELIIKLISKIIR